MGGSPRGEILSKRRGTAAPLGDVCGARILEERFETAYILASPGELSSHLDPAPAAIPGPRPARGSLKSTRGGRPDGLASASEPFRRRLTSKARGALC